MPQYFKALATITAWVLFIFGLIDLVGAMQGYLRLGSIGETAVSLAMLGSWAVGVASLILAVCAMKLRQMLE